jgi:hypothetical protein
MIYIFILLLIYFLLGSIFYTYIDDDNYTFLKEAGDNAFLILCVWPYAFYLWRMNARNKER